MDIEALRLRITDADLNGLVSRHMPKDTGIENMQMHLTPAGAVVTGVYPAMLLNVSFESLWELSALGGKLDARLASLTVAGLPAGKFRGLLLRMIRDLLAKEPGLTVGEESVTIDGEEVLRREGVQARLNLRSVRCGEGWMVVEASGE